MFLIFSESERDGGSREGKTGMVPKESVLEVQRRYDDVVHVTVTTYWSNFGRVLT